MREDDFKSKLLPEQYRVMREKGTEVAYTGKYWDSKESGIYLCAACGSSLFSSDQKVDSKDGWPAFADRGKNKNISREIDSTGNTEISCKKCGSHLGYTPKNGRSMRINSVALFFSEDPELDIELPEEEEEKEKSDKAKEMSGAASGMSFGSAGLLFAGAAVGGIVGGTAGFVMCQNAGGVPIIATSSPATTSLQIIIPTSTPASVPPSSPRSRATPAEVSDVPVEPVIPFGSEPSATTPPSEAPASSVSIPNSDGL